MKNSEERLTFGEFTLDLRRRALFRGGLRIHLTSKPLEALVFLVDQRGRVVGKDELLTAVWKDLAVTEGVLVQAVRQIRRALDDDKENPSFIQTVPREGYRFVGHVDIESSGGPVAMPSTAPGPSGRPRTRRFLQIFAGAVVVALGFVVWRFLVSGHEPPSAPPIALDGEPTRISPLTAGGISAVKPVFSPDGKALAYVSDAPEAPGVLDLFLLPLNGGDSLRLTHQVNAAGDMPVFTADGADLVFSRYRTGTAGSRLPDLWKVSSFGGTAVRYITEASGAGFSPDGAWVAYTRHLPGGRTLVMSPTDRLEERVEVNTPGFTPRWSPDGRWLAYTTSNPEGGEGDLWIVSRSITDRRQLTHESHEMYGLAWSADSGSIIFAARIGNTYHLRRVSVTTGAIDAVTTGVGEYVSPAISPDGRRLAFTLVRPVRDLAFARPVAAADVRFLTVNESHRWLLLSPSGRRIASVAQRAAADEHLYVTDVETRESRRVSDVPAAFPSWIDESQLAYLTPRGDGGSEVRRADLTSGENATLARLATLASWLAVRPGATEAAFVVKSGGRERVMLRDLASGRESVVSEGPVFASLRWRSDGRLLAWSGSRVGADPSTNGVFVVEPGRPPPRRVVADGYGPVWGADGSLFFLRYFGGSDEAGIWRTDASGIETPVRRITRADYFDIAGQALAFARSTGRAQIFEIPLR